MSDYISKSAVIKLIESKMTDGCLGTEDDTFIGGHGLVDDISDLPTLDEKEIIRKPFERVVTRLEVSEEQADIKFHDFMDNDEACHLPCEYNKADLTFERLQVFGEAIEIVKEEGVIE